MLVKYETRHLACNIAKDEKGNSYHQIWEKENKEKPIALYVDRQTMHLADEFPSEASDYKYIKEFCEIIKFLYGVGE